MKRNVYSLFEKRETHSLEEQLALLAEISQGFSSTLDISQTLNNAIEQFMEYMNAEAASIFLLETDSHELVCAECAGPVDITGLRLSSTQGIVGKTVTTRSSQMIRDVQSDPDFAKKVDLGSGATDGVINPRHITTGCSAGDQPARFRLRKGEWLQTGSGSIPSGSRVANQRRRG